MSPQKYKFKPYVVRNTDKSIEKILAEINASAYKIYCGPNTSIPLSPMTEYRKLLEEINRLGITTIPFSEADFSKPPPDDKPHCLIRHDLDIDVVAALQMAQIEKELDIRSSWYILHTAPYYGSFDKKGIFNRHQSMRHVYKELQNLGHEVALHTDGLHVYQFKKRDGAQAVSEEIKWLRSSGINIVGTTAHNSWSIYGAENFALFKGKPLRGGTKAGECPSFVANDQGAIANLQELDESELGLSYEANEVFWQNNTPVRYAAIREHDNWRWSDKQSRAVTEDSGAQHGFINSATLFNNLKLVKSEEWLVLVVHPIYYGLRHAAYAAPS